MGSMERLPEIETSSPPNHKEHPPIVQSDTKASHLLAAYGLTFIPTVTIAFLLMIPINKLLTIISLLRIPYISLLLVAFSVGGLILNRYHKDKWIKIGNIIALFFWGGMCILAPILAIVVGAKEWMIGAYLGLGTIVSLYGLGIPTLIILIIMVIIDIKKARPKTEHPSIGLDQIRTIGRWTIFSLLSTIWLVLVIRSILFMS
jgi:hypothetical protein